MRIKKKKELNLIQQDWYNADNYCWVAGNYQFTILASLLGLKIFISKKQKILSSRIYA